MKKCIEYIVFVVVLLVGRGEGYAASVSAESVSDSSRIAYRERTPGENFLQQYRDDPAFDYSVKPVAETGDWWQRLRWWLMQHIFGSYTHKDIVWLDLLLKVLAGLIVVFGIYKLVRSKFWLTAKSEPDFQKTMDPWIGEAWNELSYRQMLEQAVAANDFKLAIRIRYGGLLHLMDEKGMIRWDAHKTNRSYYYELKDKALRDDFEKLAYIFDCVCYGDFEVSASLYGQLEPVFDEFRDKLKK